jgi:hypothetical protein
MLINIIGKFNPNCRDVKNARAAGTTCSDDLHMLLEVLREYIEFPQQSQRDYVPHTKPPLVCLSVKGSDKLNRTYE